MLDLTAELRDLIDAFQRLDVEFTITGPLANSLHRGEGIHRETWGERDLLPRFDVLVATPQVATPDDIETLLVGFRQRCWAGKPSCEILEMVNGLPAGLTEQSPALAAYVRAIRVASTPRKEFRCYFLNTLAGLQWA